MSTPERGRALSGQPPQGGPSLPETDHKENEMKLCKDCRFYTADKFGRAYDTCNNAALAKGPDFVRGEAEPVYCDLARQNRDKCGAEAVFFEPRLAAA